MPSEPNQPQVSRPGLIRRYLVEARTKLHLAYPDDNPSIDELHIVGVTLKGLDKYEEVIMQLREATAREVIDATSIHAYKDDEDLAVIQGTIGKLKTEQLARLAALLRGEGGEAVDKGTDFPERILVTRQNLKESQTQFGKRFGVSHAAVSEWESGKSEAPYKVIDFVLKEQTTPQPPETKEDET